MTDLSVTFSIILKTAQSIPELETTGWHNIVRLDVRLGRGIIKNRGHVGWEAQIDAHNANILHVAQ